MRNLKPVLLKKDDFLLAWATLLKHCIANESPIIFGGKEEAKRLAAEICSRVVLEENAVKQAINGIECAKNPVFPVREMFIQRYIDEYSLEYVDEQRALSKDSNGRFTYTYYERFRYYPSSTGETIDQIEILRENVKSQIESNIFSNRHQITTWVTELDLRSSEPPCLQRIWITVVEPGAIEIHIEWRSRDLFGAWHTNLIAILNMLNRDIAIPNKCKIIRVIDSCDSLHIYAGDLDQAKAAVKYFEI